MRLTLAIALAVGGCAEARALDRELAALHTVANQARAHGAYHCAPEELALSDAHLAFAREELAQGDAVRAREHLVLARSNAHAALHASNEPSCTHGRAENSAASPSHSVGPSSDNSAQPWRRRGSTREHAAI